MTTCCTLTEITGSAFATNDLTVTMFVGPALDGRPLEIGIVSDDEGEAVIHAMNARTKFLNDRWFS